MRIHLKIGIILSLIVSVQTIPAHSAPQPTCGSIIFSSVSLPSRTIKYSDQSAPAWKIRWDRARAFFADRKFKLAQNQYDLLLHNKKNIELARWEFVNLLIQQKEWEKASTELALLLNLAPSRPDYQTAEAEILLGMGDYATAEKRFAALYDNQYKGSSYSEKIKVLQGYVAALELQNKVGSAVPLLKQLIELAPVNLFLQKKLAKLFVRNRQENEAFSLLHNLNRKRPDDPDILSSLAELYSSRGNNEKAATCWQQVIALAPNNTKAHRELIAWYKQEGNRAMQLLHSERLFALTPDNTTLLQQIADLHLLLHRPDLCLEDYRLLERLLPASLPVETRKEQVRYAVVDQLLMLLENNTGDLWVHLVCSTKDKKIIYKDMADILRVKGKRRALLEVLRALHKEDSRNPFLAQEIKVLQKQLTQNNILASSGKIPSKIQDIRPQ